MVERVINGIGIDINEYEANEVYFPESFIETFSGDTESIEDIKKNIFSWEKNQKFFPLSILWELTNRCCFNCGFCYIHTQSAELKETWTRKELNEIVIKLIDMGMLFCTLSGGECLIEPEFLYLYELLKKSGVIVSVFTNGYYIDRKIMDVFCDYKPFKVEVSVYGMEQDLFEQATSTSHDYSKVLENIKWLKESGIQVRCKTPITTVTSKSIPAIREWCEENGVDYYVSDELFSAYSGETRDGFRVLDDVYYEAVKSREREMKRKNTGITEVKKAWNCSAGKYSGVIAADRAFYPCMYSVGVEQFKYGLEAGIEYAIEQHMQTVDKEKETNLSFCKGCDSCSVCELCVISLHKETSERITEKCRYTRSICGAE